MPDTRGGPSFYEVISNAVRHFAEVGYQSETDMAEWIRRIRLAAEADLIPTDLLDQEIRKHLGAIFVRMVDRAGMLRQHPGVARFTIEQVRPQLRAEVDRRIVASADLIKLNRAEMREVTIRRFAGWATSIPPGGDATIELRKTGVDLRKATAKARYEYRRVMIDQGHKLAANLNNILAVGSGAIAAVWQHHHVRYPRPVHVARDGVWFLIRDSWAHEAGLVKPGEAGYTDQIEMVGQAAGCRCSYTYYTSLRQLPLGMLTAKGVAEMERIRALMAA